MFVVLLGYRAKIITADRLILNLRFLSYIELTLSTKRFLIFYATQQNILIDKTAKVWRVESGSHVVQVIGISHDTIVAVERERGVVYGLCE